MRSRYGLRIAWRTGAVKPDDDRNPPSGYHPTAYDPSKLSTGNSDTNGDLGNTPRWLSEDDDVRMETSPPIINQRAVDSEDRV